MVQGVGWVMQGVAKETFSQVLIVKIGCGGEKYAAGAKIQTLLKTWKIASIAIFCGIEYNRIEYDRIEYNRIIDFNSHDFALYMISE